MCPVSCVLCPVSYSAQRSNGLREGVENRQWERFQTNPCQGKEVSDEELAQTGRVLLVGRHHFHTRRLKSATSDSACVCVCECMHVYVCTHTCTCSVCSLWLIIFPGDFPKASNKAGLWKVWQGFPMKQHLLLTGSAHAVLCGHLRSWPKSSLHGAPGKA